VGDGEGGCGNGGGLFCADAGEGVVGSEGCCEIKGGASFVFGGFWVNGEVGRWLRVRRRLNR